MIVFYVSSVLAILLAAAGAVWFIQQAYVSQIEGLRADNKDLRDRLFQKNNLPPSEVNLTEKYEEKAERERERRTNPRAEKKTLGPIEQLEARWTKDDQNKTNRLNIDATKPRDFQN